MSDPDSATAFDYERIGAAFDVFLPYLEPVTAAILAHLPVLPDEATVLDLACGTGEPGLSLLKRAPGVRLIGFDAAEGMLAVARRKAAAAGLDARFDTAPLEALKLGDASVDAAISRFGCLLFGEPTASARELARVLKPGAAFSLAVWENGAANTFLRVVLEALSARGAPAGLPRLDIFDALAAPGGREGWLRDAGMRRVDSELFHWRYDFPDADGAWEIVTGSGMMSAPLAAMGDERLEEARRHFSTLLAPYARAGGGYGVPQTCRLIWGSR